MTTTDISTTAPRAALGDARSRIAAGLRRWLGRRSERKQMKPLLDCDDRVLNDIGVSRAEVRIQLARRFG